MLRSICILSFALILFSNSYSQDSKIFWVNQGAYKIQSSNLDGSNVTDIVTGMQLADGIAIDCTNTPMKLYYSERGASRIVRVNFDGSNPEEIVTGIYGIKDIELDAVNRKIYWVKDTYSDDRVSRADMDGLNSNIEDLYTSSSTFHGFNGIGIDTDYHWVFWTQSRYGLLDVIKRRTFAGTNDTTIGYFLSPDDIEVFNDKIYWIWGGDDLLMKANKNGTDVDTVLTDFYGDFFEINATAGKIFWSDNFNDKIYSANLDGSGVAELVSVIANPMGIALYVNPLTVSVDAQKDIPRKFELKQNYPNPFNPMTVISYQLSAYSNVTLSIFNTLGQRVAILVSEKQPAGNYRVEWNASDFAGGVYFYRIAIHLDKLEVDSESNNRFVKTKKLILLK